MIGEIATTPDLPPSGLGNNDEKGICLICKKQLSKYTCPKCNVGYCNLSCYKNHSNLCTKSFYEENIMQHMKSQRVTDDDKVKMMKKLQKFEQENSEDLVAEMMKEDSDSEEDSEDDEDASLSKFQHMNLDEADADTILSMLTPEQQAEFRDSVSKGKIGNWVDIWQPWWLNENEKPLVTNIAPDDDESVVPKDTPMPNIESSLPKLSSITVHPPSPMLGYNLIEIIYAYAYTLRLFNGDWTSDPTDAATTVSTLSSVLSSNTVHASCVSAVQDVVHRSLKPPISAAKEFSIATILDTANILSQKDFVLAALSNLREMFLSVEAATKKNTTIQKTLNKTNKSAKAATESSKQLALYLYYFIYSIFQKRLDPFPYKPKKCISI